MKGQRPRAITLRATHVDLRGDGVGVTGGRVVHVPGLFGGIRVPELATWSSVRHLAHSVAVVDVMPRDRDGVATMTIYGLAKAGGAIIDRVTLRRVTPRSGT